MEVPTVCFNDKERERHLIEVMLAPETLNDISRHGSAARDFFLRYLDAIVRIPAALYHFTYAGCYFEAAYLRRLKSAARPLWLWPRTIALTVSCFGIKELATQLNYNGPSGAEKAYKAALRKLKKEIHSGAFGQWISIQKAINKARTEAAADPGHYATPQTTWLDEKDLAERFICEIAALAQVHEIFSEALENEEK